MANNPQKRRVILIVEIDTTSTAVDLRAAAKRLLATEGEVMQVQSNVMLPPPSSRTPNRAYRSRA